MKEEFLHFVWKYRLWKGELLTHAGEAVEVLFPGVQNLYGGPDFKDARIRIGTETWAGNVEIHVHGSDWVKHGHAGDPNYANIILHVVYQDDGFRLANTPLCEFKGNLSDDLYGWYRHLSDNSRRLPCRGSFPEITPIDLEMWKERLLIDRIMNKTTGLMQGAESNDWLQMFYRLLCRTVGFGTNGQAFEAIAQTPGIRTLLHHTHNRDQIEAMLFGVAGLLPHEPQDEFSGKLVSEFQFLQKKYQLGTILANWNFMRLRPKNFPTVRLAQLAALVEGLPQLIAAVTADRFDMKRIKVMLNVAASGYWDSHYQFGGKTHKPVRKSLGKTAADLLMINAVLPLRFEYGRAYGNDVMVNGTLEMYQLLPAENNHITRIFDSSGLKVLNAADAQSYIGLYKEYCMQGRCVHCKIGIQALKNREH